MKRLTTWAMQDGTVVRLELNSDDYHDASVHLDGEEMEIERASRLRDGGTTKYYLLAPSGERHMLVLHNRAREEPHETLDGLPLTETTP
jgi:hypothetical protein